MEHEHRGRPTKRDGTKRSLQIRVRMSVTELYRIKKRAKELGMTISALMREGAMTYIPPEREELNGRDDSNALRML